MIMRSERSQTYQLFNFPKFERILSNILLFSFAQITELDVTKRHGLSMIILYAENSGNFGRKSNGKVSFGSV